MTTKGACPVCLGCGVAAGFRCRRCGGSGAWYPEIVDYESEWLEVQYSYMRHDAEQQRKDGKGE